jgi:hypothetical protein
MMHGHMNIKFLETLRLGRLTIELCAIREFCVRKKNLYPREVNIIYGTNKMQLWQYRLLVTARLRYMFRTLSVSIIRSTKNCSSSHWSWVGMIYIQ